MLYYYKYRRKAIQKTSQAIMLQVFKRILIYGERRSSNVMSNLERHEDPSQSRKAVFVGRRFIESLREDAGEKAFYRKKRMTLISLLVQYLYFVLVLVPLVTCNCTVRCGANSADTHDSISSLIAGKLLHLL